MRRALLVVLALALVPPVLAEAGSARVQRQDERVPSARLQATGSGAMTVVGRMVVNGTVPEGGSVVVIDRSGEPDHPGDARVHLAGEPQQFVRGRVRVRRASGILFVTGSNVLVQVLGVDLTFSVAGHGRARLIGSGTYRLNSEPERSWGETWFRVAPSASAEQRRLRRCNPCSPSAAVRT